MEITIKKIYEGIAARKELTGKKPRTIILTKKGEKELMKDLSLHSCKDYGVMKNKLISILGLFIIRIDKGVIL